MSEYDLAVIGGGPAGAAATLEAARSGLEVALFEPVLDGDKPCGEGIMPAGLQALEELGLRELLAKGRSFRAIRYLLPGGGRLRLDLPGPGCALPRPALQQALDAALRAEARVHSFRVRVASRRDAGGGFELRAGRSSVWHARLLIQACGSGGPAGSGRRLGIRARHRARRELDCVEVHLAPAVEVYLTPLPAGRVNVAVLRDGLPQGVRGAGALYAAALRACPLAAERLGECVTAPEARRLGGRPAPCPEGAFRAGDAAGAVDPILGCGVTLALLTGRLAGRAAAGQHRGTPARRQARWYGAELRRAVASRRRLAAALLFAARHPRAAGFAAGVVRRFPALGRRMVQVAAGTAA